MVVFCVAPVAVPQTWPLVERLLDDGYAAADEITPPDLQDWLTAGKGLLWVAVLDDRVLAACVTTLVARRSGLICRVMSGGGESMERWQADWLDTIERYARQEGCAKVRIDGRRGWERALSGFGYRQTGVCLEKGLGDER